MGDYAAAPIQPIVQGLLTVSGSGAGSPNVPTFNGRGISAVTRVAGPPIAYVLTLDPGLPGNAGEVAAIGKAYPAALVPGAGSGASSTTNIPVPDARCAITLRGSSSNGVVGGSDIVNTAVSYLTPGTDGGFTQVQLIFSSVSGSSVFAAVDPSNTHASGVELVIWVDADRIN